MFITATMLLHALLRLPPAQATQLEDLEATEAPAGDVETPVETESTLAIGTSKFVGLGVIGGDPNGLSGKFYLRGRTHALDFALAYRLWGPNGSAYYAHSTYLIHPNEYRELDGVVLGWHMGVGGYVGLSTVDLGNGQTASAMGIGVRAPIGVDFDLEAFPLQFFIDVAVNVGLVPSTYATAEGNLGMRYYFL
jgi:hypothetical protein